MTFGTAKGVSCECLTIVPWCVVGRPHIDQCFMP